MRKEEQNNAQIWRAVVLSSLPTPAWQAPDAPLVEYVISSRVRIARNLRGHVFSHHATPEVALQIAATLRPVLAQTTLREHNRLNPAEHDYLVGARLLSPDFEVGTHGRTLWLDAAAKTSVMVNEEDHIRAQVLTAGWSLLHADLAANQLLDHLNQHLDWQHHPDRGYLTAHPQNSGPAQRWSALLHLIGLATTGELTAVLTALRASGLVVRGLYGEGSSGSGAFIQLSAIKPPLADIIGAVEYVIEREREARREVTRLKLTNRAKPALDTLREAQPLTLAETLDRLSVIRWASAAGITGFEGLHFRQIDRWATTLELTPDPKVRAHVLQDHLNQALQSNVEAPKEAPTA